MMNALIAKQEETFSRISKGRINYKKSPKERLCVSYIETRLENVESQWQQFNDTHNKLFGISKLDELNSSTYITSDLYDKAEESYIEYKTELKHALSEFKKVEIHPHVNSSISVNKRENIRLPKITLPVFSGKYSEWTTFRDLFVSLIEQNESLDQVQKLHYLKAHLSGEAEQLLRHIPVTSGNYEQCWSLLDNRYNNTKYLCNCILKRLFNQKGSTYESSVILKELLDTTVDCLNGLKNLGIEVKTWDIIIIYIVTLKLDPETRKQWELTISNLTNELPTFNQFKEFIESRFRALECVEPRLNRYQQSVNPRVLHSVNNLSCQFCNGDHKLWFCKGFIAEGYDSRHAFVQKVKLCFNCLGVNHAAKTCNSATTCRVCRGRHHSLLHPGGATATFGSRKYNQRVVDSTEVSTNQVTPHGESETVVTCFSTGRYHKQVLLATALVSAESRRGNNQVLRALLDQGSEASFITEASVQRLGLKKIPINSRLTGIGGDRCSLTSSSRVVVKIQSQYDSNIVIQVNAYVLTTLTTFLPGNDLEAVRWLQGKSIDLADPGYNRSNKIDLLLGAEIYCQILRSGVLRGPANSVIAQDTTLGWIISGTFSSSASRQTKVNVLHSQVDESDLLKMFWEIESDNCLGSKKILSEEELKCEDIFINTTMRDDNGRYVVKLPFKKYDTEVQGGNSREISVNKFHALERKLCKDRELQIKYKEVMDEYIRLGHMELVPKTDIDNKKAIYLPHHAVIRNDKATTKVRVVFDASCKYKNNLSLNDMLMVGPTLQADLRHIVMRWRLPFICLIADIVKMYRQIKVVQEDVDYQRVIWRDDPQAELQDYRLLTVTFGTASAPYLAVKALHQVARDEGHVYPSTSERIEKDFYMDDFMSGCSSVTEGIKLYKEMKYILAKGGFELQKWNSNNEELLKEINEGESNEQGNIDIKNDNVTKVLGLTWNRKTDEFQYTVKLSDMMEPITKRKVIAEISRLFDPLGWLAPVIIVAKVFIQKIWISGIGWDDELPSVLLKEWKAYRNELSAIESFHIPRWLNTKIDDMLDVELHGFSDASNTAYAGAVYIRVVIERDNIHTALVTAKTKVAPIKQVSIPRLELCGAVLVSRLLIEVAEVMGISKNKLHAWTDSTVVLAWLNSHPNRWKTFVANRTSEILTLLDASQWSHVTTKNNPADCASRGVQPSKLDADHRWRRGPEFLREDVIHYDKPNNNRTVLEQSLKVHVVVSDETIWWEKYSTFAKLLRIVAYCRRFLSYKRGNLKTYKIYLTKKEIDESLISCIKMCQREGFQEEQTLLQNSKQIIKAKSKIASLNPYLDNVGVIRVGGRLNHAQIAEDSKHPILLPHESHFTKLLIAEAHEKTLHGGPTIMLNYLRATYWIVRAKTLVKHCIHKCVVCVRNADMVRNQLMGQLPASRVTPIKPFLRSGVDYAGPINLRTSKGRGHKSYKGYIALFICMASRAIHLEVVSDLTAQGFLAAFKRFVSRRGHCAEVWSDNGTNFVGASKELKHLFSVERSGIVSELINSLATNSTEWHFIPPHSPNFGGLWERGIRSTKHHLKRVIGNSTLTYEEMATVLTQIEACLNSRPMSQIPNAPDESLPLCPGHFLVGQPLVVPPDYNFEASNVTNLRRWQLTQLMVQHFWRRWSQEYLTQFLQRYKWSTRVPEPQVNDVVLIKEDNLPPARWLFGRVIEKHPGLDGITRVVTLRCKDSMIKRPVSKLCILPVTE